MTVHTKETFALHVNVRYGYTATAEKSENMKIIVQSVRISGKNTK